MIKLHTPGLWGLEGDPWDEETYEITAPSRAGKVAICTVPMCLDGPLFAEQAANARLILAAPVMLAVLRDARTFIKAELAVRLDSYCLKGPAGKPDISTLRGDDCGACAEAMQALERVETAIKEAAQTEPQGPPT